MQQQQNKRNELEPQFELTERTIVTESGYEQAAELQIYSNFRKQINRSTSYKYFKNHPLLSFLIIATLLLYSIYYFSQKYYSEQYQVIRQDQSDIVPQTIQYLEKIQEIYQNKIQTQTVDSQIKQTEKTQQLISQQQQTDLLQVQTNIDIASQKTSSSKIKQQAEFLINPEVWMFQRHASNYLQELMFANNKRFIELSQFKLNILNLSNYESYLSDSAKIKLKIAFKIIKEKNRQQFDSIQKRLILYSVLYERGGIILEGPLTLIENFDWVKQISTNIYVNRGNPDVQPQVVGFYSPYFSSLIQKQKKVLLQGQEEVQRYMVLIPSAEIYFMAAKKGAEYVGRFVDEMINILTFPEQITKDIQDNKYQYYHLENRDTYVHYYVLAGQRVLQAKQKEIDNQNQDSNICKFAIDHYGLFLMNCFYGPQKANWYFSNGAHRKIPQMARQTMQVYEGIYGTTRYLQTPKFQGEINEFLVKIRDQKLKKQIMNGSFLQKMYFPEANQSFIYNDTEKWVDISKAKTWDALPKRIWVWWDTGILNSRVEIILCVENLRKMGALAGFQLKEVNNSNINEYLDKNTVQKIQQTLKNAKLKVAVQSKSDLVRLALIYKYGGVYLDASTIAVQSFDRIVNIAKFPSKYIYNRYGELPSVFMFFNPYDAGKVQWQVDETANTKSGWRYQVENSIIVAQKQSEFIKDWLTLQIQMLKTPVQSVFKVLNQCGIGNFKRIRTDNHYLLAMDTALCVIGRKQAWIQKQSKKQWRNGMHYYKLWSTTTYMGPFKTCEHMNYGNTIDRGTNNPFLNRYSQDYAQGITGKMNFWIKFWRDGTYQINQFMQKNMVKIQEETHSQSFFRKYIFDSKKYRLEKKDGKMILVERS